MIHKNDNKILIRDVNNLNSFRLKIKEIHKLENKIIIAYSLKKIKTNPMEEYSILNPETNSDSPSEKSKGVRFVSAISMTNNNTTSIGINKKNEKFEFLNLKNWNDFINRINIINIIASLISYEIVCLTLRIAPIILYLLLDAHPLSILG